MNLAEISNHGCSALLSGKRIIVYDEFETCIVTGDRPSEKINIKELPDLIKKLDAARKEMLENYKSLNLTEKMEYAKRNGVSYKDMQKLITMMEIEGIL